MKSLLLIAWSGLSINILSANSLNNFLKKPPQWFQSTEAKHKLSNILSFQDVNGIWPKNINTTEYKYDGLKSELQGTFDNSASLNELRLLAKAYNATKNNTYKKAFNNGLQCILDCQYPNGGWPQRPNAKGYSEHITFNDGTMIGIMTFLGEVHKDDDYKFATEKYRRICKERFNLGVQCIIKCQIRVNGKLTAWCAQHHKEDLRPMGARSYEHPSISGGESADVVCLLMTIKNPDQQIRKSIKSAVDWYSNSIITDSSYRKVNGDNVLVKEKTINPLWARFYEIETNKPIFSGRDGKIKYRVSEIEFERRNGYAWYVSSGKKVLNAWEKWKITKSG